MKRSEINQAIHTMKNASAVVVMADPRPYGNIILKKGVVEKDVGSGLE